MPLVAPFGTAQKNEISKVKATCGDGRNLWDVGTCGATLANHSTLSHGSNNGHHKTVLMCVVFDSPHDFPHEHLLST